MHRTMSRIVTVGALVLTTPAFAACEGQARRATGPAPASPQPSAIDAAVRVDTVARGLENPWALAFLPDRRILVTERPGRLRIVEQNGTLSAPLAGVPDVAARGQGGLLDVAVDPRFGENQFIYLSYSEPADNGTSGTSVARARLGNGRLENGQVISRQVPEGGGNMHFGPRIGLDLVGGLFITQGAR